MSNYKELTLQEAALAWAQGKRVEAEALGLSTRIWAPIHSLGTKDGYWNPNVFADMSGVYKFRLAPEPPKVGSAEWANALPDGTKVRHNSWPAGRWASRSGGPNWFENAGFNSGVLLAETGWEIYPEPPAKRYRPWTPEEVPVGALTRPKDKGDVLMIIGIRGRGVLLAGDSGDYPLHGLLNLREHSTDNGKTWLPCGVEVSE